jgi:hypothetical protein
VLRAISETLEELFPTGKRVRLHSDAIAVLLPPSSERAIDADMEGQARDALQKQVPERVARAGQPRAAGELEYTIALLHLIVEQPSHWQVLGPLIWAESERALVLARAGAASGVQRRRIPLEGAVPITTRE